MYEWSLLGIYPLKIFVSEILAVLQKLPKLIKMTSNTIYIVAFSDGLKCPRKIHFNRQCLFHYFRRHC